MDVLVLPSINKEFLLHFTLPHLTLPYLISYILPSLCFSDMQKFPLRMKDNDLLVTELYRDPNGDMVTALSVYLTPKTCKCVVGLHLSSSCFPSYKCSSNKLFYTSLRVKIFNGCFTDLCIEIISII